MNEIKKVAVLMGSDSDLPVVKKGIELLRVLDVPIEVHIISAHRTPQRACAFATQAREEGFGVIIAAAGKAAHLAGVIAAYTTLPVIGLPMKSSTMDGLDSLLSTVQMPSGIPVATVAINDAQNAAILAAQILGVHNTMIAQKLTAMKQDMAKQVMQKDQALTADF